MEQLSLIINGRTSLEVCSGHGGIGFETCRQLASNRILVVLTAKDERGILILFKNSKESGIPDDLVVFHQLDVVDVTSIASLEGFIKTQFGRLDILEGAQVNWSEIITQTSQSAEECLKTDCYGAKTMAIAMIPSLQLSDSPRIVNVSSSMGKFKNVTWAKGVLGDTENLAEERIDEVLSKYLKDFIEDSLETEGWPALMSPYYAFECSYESPHTDPGQEVPYICINCVP